MNDAMSGRSHPMPPEQFAALARGGGDPAAIGQLVAAEHSKHLILLARVAELARRRDRPDDGMALAAWDLLAQARQHDKAAADEVISYPSVGAWALHTIRGDQAMPGARPSGLAAVAAAAAIRAGLDSEIEVPVVGGNVMLPSLGAADAAGATAIVATRPAEIRSDDLVVEMRPGAPGWRGLSSATAGSLAVLIDDLDPFRMPATDGQPTGRLMPPQVRELEDSLRAAWTVLSTASAAQVAAIVKVIVPYQAPESGHVSTTSPQAFGTVAMSRQPDKYTCAETLVHETQHLKLCALLDLVTLTRPVDDGRRYYAPWRKDPRPASGLLQGTYAFLGVCGFWREQRRAAPEQAIRERAQAEFAHWREGVAGAVGTLLSSGQLTGHGQAFVAEMADVLQAWQRERVPHEAVVVARRKSERHLAQWHADNG